MLDLSPITYLTLEIQEWSIAPYKVDIWGYPKMYSVPKFEPIDLGKMELEVKTSILLKKEEKMGDLEEKNS